MFAVAMSFFVGITLSATPLKCVSMNNQKCKVTSEVVNVNSDESVFYPFSIKTIVNAAVVVTISMIHTQKCEFLMLLKT